MGRHSEVLRSHRFGFDGNRMREQIERAGGGAHLAGGNAQIAGGGSQAAMAEQELNGADVGALFEEVNGECVPQRMGRDGFGNLASGVGFLTCLAQPPPGDVPVLAYRRERASAGVSPRATTRAEFPAVWARALRSDLSCPLPCSTRKTMRLLSMAGGLRGWIRKYAGRRHSTWSGWCDACLLSTSQKLNHFLGAEDDGQRLRLLGSGDDVVEAPVFLRVTL